MKRGAKKTTRPRASRRPVDVTNPLELLSYLDASHRSTLRSELRLDRLEEQMEETRRVVQDVVNWVNAQTASPAPREASPSAAPAPAAPSSSAVAVASIASAKQARFMRLLLAKRPDLAAKLNALQGCPSHAVVNLACEACQRSALERLLPGGVGELAELMGGGAAAQSVDLADVGDG